MKILILMMSCNKKHFKTECAEMKKILNKHIKKLNLIDEISIYDYVGDADELHEENGTIYCTSGDNLLSTYHKTIECFRYIDKNIEYDYIFRTNTSTFINIELMYHLIKKIDDEKLSHIVYGTEIISVVNSFTPRLNDFYLRGNGLILSKEIIQTIIKHRFDFMDSEEYPNAGTSFHIYENTCSAYIDDICIGTVLNIINYKNYKWFEIPGNCFRVFKHGWYDCETPWQQYDVDNGACEWDNMSLDFEFLKQFVTIQVKSYVDPNTRKDIKKIKKLSNAFINKTNNEIEQTVKDNMEFTPHCKCFIGAWRKTPYMPITEVLSFINIQRKEDYE